MTRRALRAAIAREAARLMSEEGVGQYFHAKHQAAQALLGARVSGAPLPSNREIRAALVRRTQWLEGPARVARLRQMRGLALHWMGVLQDFEPRLIGSVASGAIHANSDIDVQLFTDRVAHLERLLWEEEVDFEREDKVLSGPHGPQHFLHFHFAVEDTAVELSVYPSWALHAPSPCSITGKAMDRVPIGRVAALFRAVC